MAKVERNQEFNKSADEMWELIGDFAGLHKFADVPPAEMSEDGKVRKFAMGPNHIVERLIEEGERSYTYIIEDSPLPVANYKSTLSVSDAGDGKCVVNWVGTFDPAEGSDEQAGVQIVSMVYDGGLAGMAKAAGS